MSVFPELLADYLSFCKSRHEVEKSGVLDLRDFKVLTPSVLLFGEFIRNHPDSVRPTFPPSDDVERAISSMIGHGNSLTTAGSLVKLPEAKIEADHLLENNPAFVGFENVCGGKTAFRYLVYELVDNAYQHSNFSNAAVMVYPSSKKTTTICIFDNGVSIPGSFRQNGLDCTDDGAVLRAVNGTSTKKGRERGYGLGSSLKITTKPFGGKALIVSGAGAFYADPAAQGAYRLADSDSLHGTLIVLSIPETLQTVDIYAYLGSGPLPCWWGQATAFLKIAHPLTIAPSILPAGLTACGKGQP
ncbi:hypothetical protein HY994_03415 [Candidatus Micrarchaeota archaeon]|nr:hypothetical protein [Candidatus Micrarchaeota archaeon]